MPDVAAEKSLLLDEAQTALRLGEYENAYHALLALLRLDENIAEAYFLLARIAQEFHNLDKAVEMLRKALAIEPGNSEYAAGLAKALVIKGDIQGALVSVKKAEKLEHQSALSLDAIGIVYNRLSMYREASEFFKKAVGLEKNNAGIFFNLASTLKFCGDFAGARRAYEQAIALNPLYYKAHAALTSLGGITADNNHVERLQGLLPAIRNADDALHIAHALSKELEVLGEFDRSLHFLQRAKQQKLGEIAYYFADDQDVFNALESHFTQTEDRGSGCMEKGALFVVGMPRSGTTLVERIISNHREVSTAGELHNFALIAKHMLGNQSSRLIDKSLIQSAGKLDLNALGRAYLQSTRHLAKGKAFVIDKLPLNVLYAGFILQALPNTKMVCLDRDLLDTIVSNYRQLFSFYDLTYGYSLSLMDTARYCVEFKQLVRLWQDLFPHNFYVVNYEQLVQNPHDEVRKLLHFCELEWQDDCLLIENNQSPVATASSVQVRSPITDKSVGQWKKYESHLGDVKKFLQDEGLL